MAHLEEGNRREDGTLSSRLHREGHKVRSGALSQSLHSCSTYSCVPSSVSLVCAVLAFLALIPLLTTGHTHMYVRTYVVQWCFTHCVQGILTTDLSAAVEGVSTVSENYCQPEGPQVRCVGRRREALLHQLQAMVSRDVEEEFTPIPPPMDYRSTTKKDFFQGDKPCCVVVHDKVLQVCDYK